MKTRIYYIAKERRGRTSVFSGTLTDLIDGTFGYVLMCGNSWNRKIPTEPKTVKSLVSALNRSVNETQGGCYERDYYFQTSQEQAEANGWSIY